MDPIKKIAELETERNALKQLLAEPDICKEERIAIRNQIGAIDNMSAMWGDRFFPAKKIVYFIDEDGALQQRSVERTTFNIWMSEISSLVHEITQGQVFKVLTYFRSVGGMVFVFGGLLPLMYVVLSGGSNLKKETELPEVDWRNYEANWAHEKDE